MKKQFVMKYYTSGFIWLRLKTNSRFLWRWKWIFRFHKRQRISWL